MPRIINKKKFIRGIAVIVIALVIIISILWFIVSGIISLFTKKDEDKQVQASTNTVTSNEITRSTY